MSVLFRKLVFCKLLERKFRTVPKAILFHETHCTVTVLKKL